MFPLKSLYTVGRAEVGLGGNLRFSVWGLRFRDWGLGCGDWGLRDGGFSGKEGNAIPIYIPDISYALFPYQNTISLGILGCRIFVFKLLGRLSSFSSGIIESKLTGLRIEAL